jgi:hypothetical protein
MPILPIPIQYDGDDDAFLHAPKFVARPVITVEFTAANTDVQVLHQLGKVPLGYHVVGRSGNFVVYNGTVPSSESDITLRASGTGTATIFVF